MKKLIAAIVTVALAVACCGCSSADKKSREISRNADEFGVTRRITVINTRTDTILRQLTGTFSTQHSSGDLDVIVEMSDGEYVKHYFDLNDWTTYVVEDMTSEHLPEHYYEMRFLPNSDGRSTNETSKEADNG